MLTPTYPSVDESLDRRRRAGWSVGGAPIRSGQALAWCVSGNNGENKVKAFGADRAEAWWRAHCRVS